MSPGALAALLLLAAGGARTERIVPTGGTIPEMRACIDYVGRGALRTVGEGELIEDPDDLIGHAIYHFEFRERAELLGHATLQKHKLVQAGHALRSFDISDTVVFLALKGKNTRFVDWEWVWKDKAGKPFIPIFRWPDTKSRGVSWEPLAIRSFARRVEYRDPQPYWPEFQLAPEDEEPGLIETQNGRTRVLNGVYLSDLAKLFEAARSEECWR